MVQDTDTLVLEITRQDSRLSMSVFERRELASTVRHYSRCLISFNEIKELCQEILSILNKANRKTGPESDLIQALKKTGQLLWDNLLTKSVKDRLKAAVTKELILSLDEELISIPWELLYTGDDFLCLRFNVGRLVRTQGQANVTRQYRSAQNTFRMLILANPTKDLKSAYLEGLQIKNRFDRQRNRVRIDFKSTHIDTLYVKKAIRDYDMVHFAGHCEYDSDNPQNSGWVLSDGRFTGGEILALSDSPSLPFLVFSNACHSARISNNLLGPDYQEKAYSVASSFLFSGVRHYIGAIYKVEDGASLTFAQEFYTQLIRGETVGQSMRSARLRLIKEYGSNMLSWVSYILYGDPNFALFESRSRSAAPKIKSKDFLRKYKLPVFKVALVALIISLCFYLYRWLPTLSPGSYITFLKMQELFSKGKNETVISLAQGLINKDPLFLSTYQLLGDAYQRLGDRSNALKYYFDYVLYSEKKGSGRDLSSAYIGIGWIYHLQGQYSHAFDFYNKAINVSRDNKDSLNEAAALRKLAVWYIDKEDYERAMELLTKSSEINLARQNMPGYKYNLACDYFDIGLIFTNKDDFATAKKFYHKSSLLLEKLKLKSEFSDYYFNLGEICLFEKQYQRALDYYMRGLKIDQEHGNKPSLASDYNMIGELCMEMGKMDEAENYFQESVSICSVIDTPPELASAYYNLGLLYRKLGRRNKAREHFRQAQEIYWAIDKNSYAEVKKELLELN